MYHKNEYYDCRICFASHNRNDNFDFKNIPLFSRSQSRFGSVQYDSDPRRLPPFLSLCCAEEKEGEPGIEVHGLLWASHVCNRSQEDWHLRNDEN